MLFEKKAYHPGRHQATRRKSHESHAFGSPLKNVQPVQDVSHAELRADPTHPAPLAELLHSIQGSKMHISTGEPGSDESSYTRMM